MKGLSATRTAVSDAHLGLNWPSMKGFSLDKGGFRNDEIYINYHKFNSATESTDNSPPPCSGHPIDFWPLIGLARIVAWYDA